MTPVGGSFIDLVTSRDDWWIRGQSPPLARAYRRNHPLWEGFWTAPIEDCDVEFRYGEMQIGEVWIDS